jgi:hypothetical protein
MEYVVAIFFLGLMVTLLVAKGILMASRLLKNQDLRRQPGSGGGGGEV